MGKAFIPLRCHAVAGERNRWRVIACSTSKVKRLIIFSGVTMKGSPQQMAGSIYFAIKFIRRARGAPRSANRNLMRGPAATSNAVGRTICWKAASSSLIVSMVTPSSLKDDWIGPAVGKTVAKAFRVASRRAGGAIKKRQPLSLFHDQPRRRTSLKCAKLRR